MSRAPQHRMNPPTDLTPRELEYAKALATGERPRDISARWGVSKNALNSYQARACEKLGLYNRHQLAAWARGIS